MKRALAVVALAACGPRHSDASTDRIVIAHAAPPVDAATEPDPVSDPPGYVEVEGDRDTARGHYDEGRTAYNLGDYARAADEFKAAYQAWPMPAFLYNIGQCYRQLGDAAQAVFFFKRYLAEDPDAKNRAQVEGLIDALSNP